MAAQHLDLAPQRLDRVGQARDLFGQRPVGGLRRVGDVGPDVGPQRLDLVADVAFHAGTGLTAAGGSGQQLRHAGQGGRDDDQQAAGPQQQAITQAAATCDDEQTRQGREPDGHPQQDRRCLRWTPVRVLGRHGCLPYRGRSSPATPAEDT
ncbi:hypothetical protein Vau01_013540 [Virgisporangium aurantiacum]|uniref:Uncharacterized protein n=1 Tax=Virgisporangium aurantiacum TaxID=175570 RepID=A0A8J3Z024_9ACTN|nr:hypothetical protein Vau01_013540 [Virgisporangium aurantiacum]